MRITSLSGKAGDMRERLFMRQKSKIIDPEKLMRNAIRNNGDAIVTIFLFITKEVDQRAKRSTAYKIMNTA